MTVNLPVWNSHCTRARFTVLVQCSELLSAPFPVKVGCEACVRTVLLLVFIV